MSTATADMVALAKIFLGRITSLSTWCENQDELEEALEGITYVERLLIAAEGGENEQNRICITGKILSGVSERCMQSQICRTGLCDTVGDSLSMDRSVPIGLSSHCSKTNPLTPGRPAVPQDRPLE